MRASSDRTRAILLLPPRSHVNPQHPMSPRGAFSQRATSTRKQEYWRVIPDASLRFGAIAKRSSGVRARHHWMDAARGDHYAENKSWRPPNGSHRIGVTLIAAVAIATAAVAAAIGAWIKPPLTSLTSDTPTVGMAEVFLTVDGPPPSRSLGVQVSVDSATQADQHATLASRPWLRHDARRQEPEELLDIRQH